LVTKHRCEVNGDEVRQGVGPVGQIVRARERRHNALRDYGRFLT